MKLKTQKYIMYEIECTNIVILSLLKIFDLSSSSARGKPAALPVLRSLQKYICDSN